MKIKNQENVGEFMIALRVTGFLLILGAIPLFFEYNYKSLAIAVWVIVALFLFLPKKYLIKKEYLKKEQELNK